MLNLLDSLACFVLRGLFLVLRMLPPRWGLFFVSRLFRFFLLFMPRSFSVAEKNLRTAFPDIDNKRIREIYQASIDSFCSNLLALARTPDMNAETARATSNVEQLDAFISQLQAETPGRGVLVATMHFSSFERLMQCYVLLGGKLAVLARGLGLEKTDGLIDDVRESFGIRVFRRKGGLADIIDKLKQGENVAVLCDQNVKRNHAVFVDFFGVKAATTRAISVAAERTGANVAFVAAVENSDGYLDISMKRIDSPVDRTLSAHERAEQLMLSVHREMEDLIRKHPEHWFWIHRRFKTRPPGLDENFYHVTKGVESTSSQLSVT
ncbi:MAG: hypothetical protein PHC51_11290 [bacterium]|nr:hypothetical protein [bacterium]